VPNVRVRRSAIADDYEVYIPMSFIWKVIPPHMKKP